jgi:hypothetical protein
MRTSVLIGVRPPTVVYSPCCSTRSRRVLRFHRHVADFVEEECTTLRLFETTGGAVLRAGEGALSWPNSSDLIRSRGIAAMLIATKGPPRRRPYS